MADSLLVSTLRWLIDQTTIIWKDAIKAAPGCDESVLPQLEALAFVGGTELLRVSSPIRPSHGDLIAIGHEGYPWSVVGHAASAVLALDGSSAELALRLLGPDADIDGRLFHLAILGEFILALRAAGASVRSLRPLGVGLSGPAYSVTDAYGDDWDLWFEAAGIWRYYDVQSPYTQATKGTREASRPLGADMMLIRPGDRALIVECKFSENTETVARRGYTQAIAYAAEAVTELVKESVAVAIGPSVTIARHTAGITSVGPIGIGPPESLKDVVLAFL